MFGRISGDSRAIDAMSNQDGIIVNNGGLHLVMTGPGDVNKGGVKTMGRQIYETFLPCEVVGQCEAKHS